MGTIRTTVDAKITETPVEANGLTEEVKENVAEQVSPEIENDEKLSSDNVVDNEDGDNKPSHETKNKDEYGNETVEKLYTQDEVNQMMRERHKREAKKEESKQHEEVDKSEGNWEAELENFVASTVKKLSQKEEHQKREEQNKRMQAEFEEKMFKGMGKYKDFADVVGGKPITDAMVLATRQMKDPAAFLYAASKTQSKELERISQIADPYFQAAEMGRLEEKMKKLSGVTNSPKPVSDIRGDIESRGGYQRGNVDDLIRKHGLKKFNNRR